MWLITTDRINLEHSQLGNTEFRKIDMKSSSICGCTYHCGLTESALCAHCAQMWGGSAEAQAHWKYFYRSAVWLSCSVKSAFNIDFVFYYFPHWKTISIAQVNGAPSDTLDGWIYPFIFRFFNISRWPEPPKCLTWHEMWGINTSEVTYFHIFMTSKRGNSVWSEPVKPVIVSVCSWPRNYHDIMYSTFSDAACLAAWGKSNVCSGTRSQCSELFVEGSCTYAVLRTGMSQNSMKAQCLLVYL